MEPRLQVLAGVGIGVTLIAVGLVRASRGGYLFTAEHKVDYGYVLKLILLSLAFAAVAITTMLTMVFLLSWGIHVDSDGTTTPLNAFMPTGYAPQYAMSLVAVGTLVTFASKRSGSPGSGVVAWAA